MLFPCFGIMKGTYVICIQVLVRTYLSSLGNIPRGGIARTCVTLFSFLRN